MPRQIFLHEVERQCKFALMAYEDLKQALTVFQQRSPAQPEINWTYADVAQFQAAMARHDQWLAAMAAHERIHTAAEERFWYSVQAFLVAVGNISKILWPTYWKGEKLLSERGPELRTSLEVEEDSPLKPRTLRNHFEHFDLRLERWALSPKHHGFIDSNMGPTNAIRGVEPEDYLRHFDPRNFAVTFLGKGDPLPPIAEAIEQLWHKATVQLQERASA